MAKAHNPNPHTIRWFLYQVHFGYKDAVSLVSVSLSVRISRDFLEQYPERQWDAIVESRARQSLSQLVMDGLELEKIVPIVEHKEYMLKGRQ